MDIKQQIETYITSQPGGKCDDLHQLDLLIRRISSDGKLWFDDGKNDEGKTVANPTIGYGSQIIKYADGKTRDFFQIGLSANTSGISVYILGIKDKTYLSQTYGKELGKASVTGYCIKFKKLQDINLDVLQSAIRYGLSATSEK